MAGGSARLVATFDGWALLRAPLELRKDGGLVRLQEQPLQILELLVQKPGSLVTREELIARLWPDSVVDFDAGLNTAVRKLRAAIGDDAEAPKYLETVPRQGYRFIGPLEPGLESGVVASGVAPAPTPAAPAPWDPLPAAAPSAPIPVVRPASRRRAIWTPAAVAVGGLTLAGGIALVFNRPTAGDAATPAAAAASAAARAPASTGPALRRVAVLPCDNLSPDAANAFFADGIHGEIVSALGSRSAALEVISRTTMLTYRATPRPVPAAARDLGATHVLECSVRREGTTVRVSVQLVDAAADRQVWSHSYQRTLVDAMTLQVQIAQEVAGQLAVQLPTVSGAQRPPRSPEAYDHWLKGVLAWQQVGGAASQEVDRIEAMFTRAIELDDEYAAAYADRARIRIARLVSGAQGSEEQVAGARRDLALAQRYAGGTPHVLVRDAQLAFLVDHDLPRALGLIEAAEQSGPLNADFLMTKGSFLMSAKRPDESVHALADAARLDPGNAGIYRFWVASLAVSRRPADALRVLEAFDSRYPGRLLRGEFLFAFTGDTTRWWEEVSRLRGGGDMQSTLSAEFDLLRYEGRAGELRARLAAASGADFAQHNPFGARVGASRKPVAELRGWERLLAGDRAGAAGEGRALAAFVERLPKTAWNEWWRLLLAAESALLRGERVRAIDQARAITRLIAARVFAWAGAHDDAVTLLEVLSRDVPGVGPATIVRDPLFSTPLAGNPRWRALAQSLRAELDANQRLLR
jgi:TolB-like protein/DNA-binding winged helix-turn-helix (wHTH) protein